MREALVRARLIVTAARQAHPDLTRRILLPAALPSLFPGMRQDADRANQRHASVLSRLGACVRELQQDIEQASWQVAQLQAREEQLQWQLQQSSTYAGRDGVIDDVLRYRGERVQPGSTLMTLAVSDSAYARVYLPASVIAHWQVGQQLNIWLQGRETALSGTVRYISTEAAFTPHFALHQQERSRLVYLTEISLTDSKDLISGTPVRVELP